jgi:hypothetical protein
MFADAIAMSKKLMSMSANAARSRTPPTDRDDAALPMHTAIAFDDHHLRDTGCASSRSIAAALLAPIAPVPWITA